MLTSYSAVRLFKPMASADPRTKAFVDSILFWGGFAAIAGMFGTLVGIVIATQAAEAGATLGPWLPAGPTSSLTTLVWGGIKVALLSACFGVIILASSSLAWFALQFRWRLLEAAEAQEELMA